MFCFFFFFKQKTAYEFSACLVGSEMCIRDRQQARRPKPERFNMADIVCENVYRRKDGPALREMFAGRCALRGYDAWMDAFCQRKYNSDFSREMTCSVEAYLRDYGLVRAEDGGEDGTPGTR